ncbi:hypothetical protein [Tritonibacter horizontis]|uniref:Uncharacterized protein n=1 Tax=Tritonibacter horizontis TaxID=1768241 RepID=A0A132BY53_9RHOB|nr:hypothetical protein [Tritonibacter horizontis]KUP93329.1 hypothetical protein TRIHO_18260 [Tritonibacter horizontis]
MLLISPSKFDDMLPEIPKIERRASDNITPEQEDAGLFKGGLISVQLALVPVFAVTSRGDCSVRAFNAEGNAVMVLFAGRRRAHFQPVYSQLRYMYLQAEHFDAARGREMRNINSIQLSVQCEGTWRAVIETEEDGTEQRVMNFLLARWAFKGHDGSTLSFGTAPRLPKKPAGPKRPVITPEHAYAAVGAGWSSALRQRSGL